MINWNESDETEPIFILRYSDKFIERQIKENDKLNYERFICHAHVHERLIELVTKESKHHHLFVEKRQEIDSFEQNLNQIKIPMFEMNRNHSKHNEIHVYAIRNMVGWIRWA